jgi:hypothetical protein
MKKMLLAAAALFIAAPAFAQSYDPEVGTGNIAPAQAAPWGGYEGARAYTGAHGAFSRIPAGTQIPGAAPAVDQAQVPVYDARGRLIDSRR